MTEPLPWWFPFQLSRRPSGRHEGPQGEASGHVETRRIDGDIDPPAATLAARAQLRGLLATTAYQRISASAPDPDSFGSRERERVRELAISDDPSVSACLSLLRFGGVDRGCPRVTLVATRRRRDGGEAIGPAPRDRPSAHRGGTPSSVPKDLSRHPHAPRRSRREALWTWARPTTPGHAPHRGGRWQTSQAQAVHRPRRPVARVGVAGGDSSPTAAPAGAQLIGRQAASARQRPRDARGAQARSRPARRHGLSVTAAAAEEAHARSQWRH